MASEKDRKSGAANALNKFLEKDWLEQQKMSGLIKKRKHGKPEKLVEESCVKWMRDQGWSVNIFEAKATYSPKAGRYISQSMAPGICDCIGTMPDGTSVFLEFKAEKKLKTFWSERNHRQQTFMIDKINMFAFAAVVDSVQRLIDIYECWRKLNDKDGKNYLMTMLEKV